MPNAGYMGPPYDERLAQALALHRKATVIDSHVDTTQRTLNPEWDFSRRHEDGHVDLVRLREGGVSGVFFAVFALPNSEPGACVAAAKAQFAAIHRTIESHANKMTLCRTADDVHRARASGKLAALPAIEGGHLIECSLDVLREFRDRGAVYMTLTHAAHNDWADSAGVHAELPPRHGGLTDFGRQVIREMNRLGMMVDVSHVSDDTVRDVLEASSAPVIASHSSCRAVSQHRRNLSDELIRAIADRGGVVQINFHPGFIDPDFPEIPESAIAEWWHGGGVMRKPLTDHRTPLSLLVDHFDHAIELVGYDHVGIGSDFDGIPAVTEGMEDCSKLPFLTAELLRKGHREADLIKVLGQNILRVMDACHNEARDQ